MQRLPEDVLARCDLLPKKPAPVTLTGTVVMLRPLDLERDLDTLFAVSNGQPFTLGDRRIDAYDPEALIWRWMKGGPFADAAALRAYLAALIAAPDTLPLVVLVGDTPVGVAVFMSNSPGDLRIELGSIWYGPIAQGTGASREATYLMCAHAFGLGYR